MHELDDKRLFAKVITSLEAQLGVSGIYKAGSGNEFIILQAELSSGSVVIKVPKDRVFSNANDAHIDSQVLLDQEFALMRHARANGIIQIPEPISAIEAAGFGAVIMAYVPSDDSKPDEYKLGQLLASIHSIEAPGIALSAQEGSEIPALIAGRLSRRWGELSALVSDLPDLLPPDVLTRELEPLRAVKQLLHMDFRTANFRMQQSEVAALLDWSNALIGHPAVELARVAETGETGDEFLGGYASVRTIVGVSETAEIILRLDTAVMLALVFLSEEPDPERGYSAVNRVLELRRSL